jgi:hypothetical protein
MALSIERPQRPAAHRIASHPAPLFDRPRVIPRPAPWLSMPCRLFALRCASHRGAAPVGVVSHLAVLRRRTLWRLHEELLASCSAVVSAARADSRPATSDLVRVRADGPKPSANAGAAVRAHSSHADARSGRAGQCRPSPAGVAEPPSASASEGTAAKQCKAKQCHAALRCAAHATNRLGFRRRRSVVDSRARLCFALLRVASPLCFLRNAFGAPYTKARLPATDRPNGPLRLPLESPRRPSQLSVRTARSAAQTACSRNA